MKAIDDYSKAIENYDEIIPTKPNQTDAYNDRGNAWFKLGRHEEVIKDYSEVIRIRPNNTKTYYVRGISWLNLGEKEKALDDFKRVLAHANEQDDDELSVMAVNMARNLIYQLQQS